jgi:CspA family cold shock protein
MKFRRSTTSRGVVKFYKADKGWGAISSDDLPTGRDAWVHFAVIEGEGFRALSAGQIVEFTWRRARQDSFEYVVLSARAVGSQS